MSQKQAFHTPQNHVHILFLFYLGLQLTSRTLPGDEYIKCNYRH